MIESAPGHGDLRDIKGQETAKRALEVTAAGGHNLLMLFFIDPGNVFDFELNVC